MLARQPTSQSASQTTGLTAWPPSSWTAFSHSEMRRQFTSKTCRVGKIFIAIFEEFYRLEQLISNQISNTLCLLLQSVTRSSAEPRPAFHINPLPQTCWCDCAFMLQSCCWTTHLRTSHPGSLLTNLESWHAEWKSLPSSVSLASGM